MIIYMCGLPGVGKTTLATKLAQSLNASLISSDEIRTRINLRGNYGDSNKWEVYRRMLQCCLFSLKTHSTVILDASFSKEVYREMFWNHPCLAHQEWRMIRVDASESCVKNRLKTVRKYSEADFEVYQQMKASFEPIQVQHLLLNTSHFSQKELLKRALAYIMPVKNETAARKATYSKPRPA